MADTTPIVETTVTEKKVGDAATQQPPPPQIIADDNARKWLAVGVIVQFLLVIGYIVYTGKGQVQASNTELMILGAEVTFMTTVLNYYFGSSSGSTAKSQILDTKTK
jgi:hypothetical protein